MIALAAALATLAAILIPLARHGLFDPHPGTRGVRGGQRPHGRHVLAVPAMDARPAMPHLTIAEAM